MLFPLKSNRIDMETNENRNKTLFPRIKRIVSELTIKKYNESNSGPKVYNKCLETFILKFGS